MARLVGALVAASIASSFGMAVFSDILFALAGTGTDQVSVFRFAVEAVATGVATYLGFFAPLLLVSVLLSFFLAALKCRSAGCAAFGGALLWALINMGLDLMMSERAWTFLPIAVLSGAVNGWVYWLVALRERSIEESAP